MYSLVILLVFIAFLLLYNLSKKNNWEHKPAWAKSIEANKGLSRGLSFGVMAASLIILMSITGFGSAIFIFIVILMAVGSAIVLLAPFQYFNAKHLAVLFVLSVVFELFIF